MAKSRKSPPKKQSTKARSPRRRLWWRVALVAMVLLAGWVVYLDAIVTSRFEGRRFQVPSRVYARPLELYQGASLTASGLAWELRQLGFRQTSDLSRPGTYEQQGGQFELHTRGFLFPDGREPQRRLSLTIRDDKVTSLNVAQGSSASLVRLSPLQIGGIYPAEHSDRILVQLKDTPPLLRKTLIEVEDRGFEHEIGIAPLSILRALWVDLKAGHAVQGASTLTQQLARNLFLTRNRTLTRKLTEAVMAVLLDLHYSKDEILDTYYNEVYLGQDGRRAIRGFGLASEFYFGQPLDTLKLPQIALLVGMVKGPSYYDPRRHPEQALSRRNLIIRMLAKQGIVSQAQARHALDQPLGVVEKPAFSTNRYPAFIDLVRRDLDKNYRESDLRSAGLRIFTTLNPQVEHAAEQAESETLKRLDHPGDKDPLEGAMVVTSKDTGEVLGIVGGRDPHYAGFNRALDAHRQIGSLVKPAIYLAALSHPKHYTLITKIHDAPISVKLSNGQDWTPHNFERHPHGEVPLHKALADSYNLSAVHVGLNVGLDQVIDTMHSLGVEEKLPHYPALLLGAANLTPLDVTAMYQSIAGNGFRVPLRTIRDVTTADNHELSRYTYQVQQAADPRAVHLVQYAMQEVVREGTAKTAYNYLPQQLAAAGKTGTTDDSRDSWFAGFTGDYLAVAWVGRDDNKPTRFTGATGALRVWSNLMSRLPQHALDPVVPNGVTYYWVDDKTGKLTDKGCPGARYVPFINGSQPKQSESCGGALGSRIHQWFDRMFR